jgi:hypothetical protein
MKSRIFMVLFALPFAGFGSFMLYSVGSDLADAWQMQGWQPVQGRLLEAGYETRSDEESTTYKAYATYTYRWQSQSYTNERVGIADGADNIGSYQQDLGHRLSRALADGGAITVWVNPDAPWDSILDRSVRWGFTAFKMMFVLLFGGVGFGLLIFAVLSPKRNNPDEPRFADQPWLVNAAWQGGPLKSGSKAAMWGAWGFATVWNLIAMPLPFLLFEEITVKQNYLALIGLVFPIVGLGLLYWATTKTREWRRFGPTPLTLDPFPGSIGGHVGGMIDLRQPYLPGTTYTLTLTNLESTISRSGKNRSRRENASWQDRRIAHAESGPLGTRLLFRFDVPEGLEASDAAQQTDDYTIWRLGLEAELEGSNLDRSWELPVYPTAERSRNLNERELEAAQSVQSTADAAAVAERIEIRHTAAGKSLYYPMGRNAWSALMGVVFGGIFAAAGWFLMFGEGAMFIGGIFSIVGWTIILFALYMGSNSLEVWQDGVELHSKRRLFGLTVRHRKLHRNAFNRFEKNSTMQSQSGGKHTFHYSVYAIGRSAERITLGEGFHGESEADAAIRLIARELGLPLPDEPSANDDDPLEYNALAADN